MVKQTKCLTMCSSNPAYLEQWIAGVLSRPNVTYIDMNTTIIETGEVMVILIFNELEDQVNINNEILGRV